MLPLKPLNTVADTHSDQEGQGHTHTPLRVNPLTVGSSKFGTPTGGAPTGDDKKFSSSSKSVSTGITIAALAFSMLALSFASAPLYDAFCRLTGWDGTPIKFSDIRSSFALSELGDKQTRAATASVIPMEIRFDANVTPNLPWRFDPTERTQSVKPGEVSLAYYRATNTSDTQVTGQASFNVSPPIAGAYFVKIDCFCFTEQVLDPGQSVDMPVTFYVDPQIVQDPETAHIDAITLSYTFFAQS